MTEPAPVPSFRIGWVPITWKGAKVACAKCGRRVRAGTVHVDHRHLDPPPRVLCPSCVREIMAAGRPENLN